MEKRIKFVQYRRKRNGRTNYRKRLNLLVSGSTRMIVRKTNKHIMVQLANYADNGDHVLVTANSSELKKHGWDHATGNIPAAYLTGMLAAKKAAAKKVKSAIVDLGLQTPSKGSRLYAAIKGAIDAGLSVPCSEEAFPSEERIKGKHISDHTKKSGIEKSFDDVKSKLMK
jgi:large subunit ribosomal protein L18